MNRKKISQNCRFDRFQGPSEISTPTGKCLADFGAVLSQTTSGHCITIIKGVRARPFGLNIYLPRFDSCLLIFPSSTRVRN